MSERDFWNFFWLTAVRLPWSFRRKHGYWMMVRCVWLGSTTLIAARYL